MNRGKWKKGMLFAAALLLSAAVVSTALYYAVRNHERYRQQTRRQVWGIAQREAPHCPVGKMRVVEVHNSLWIVRACDRFVTVLCRDGCVRVPNGYRP